MDSSKSIYIHQIHFVMHIHSHKFCANYNNSNTRQVLNYNYKLCCMFEMFTTRTCSVFLDFTYYQPFGLVALPGLWNVNYCSVYDLVGYCILCLYFTRNSAIINIFFLKVPSEFHQIIPLFGMKNENFSIHEIL